MKSCRNYTLRVIINPPYFRIIQIWPIANLPLKACCCTEHS